MKKSINIIDPSSTEQNRGSFCYAAYLCYNGMSLAHNVNLIESFQPEDLDSIPDADIQLVCLWSYPQIEASMMLAMSLPFMYGKDNVYFVGYSPLIKQLGLRHIEEKLEFDPLQDEAFLIHAMEQYPVNYHKFKRLLLSDCDMHLRHLDAGEKVYPLFTSYGCPNACLTGDTVIHTTEGDLPIIDLIGRDDVKVLSRDPKTQEPVYVKAEYIRKTQTQAFLVRVLFDDGSHIDCTLDHKFMVFKAKNQYIEESEWEVEAQDLQSGQSVRAIRYENQKNRIILSTRRNITRLRSRIMLESKIGRKLTKDEFAHHIDKNPNHDVASNLALTNRWDHISVFHSEVSERMRTNNPTKNMTQEWRDNIGKAGTGKVRTLEQRQHYRDSKLGTKNPNYKEGAYVYQTVSKIKELGEVNHKVVSVLPLPYTEDVYCMEVLGINWFYANHVLVHNCAFCPSTINCGKRRFEVPLSKVCTMLDQCIKQGIKSIHFTDEDFFFDISRAFKILLMLQGKGMHLIALSSARAATEFIDKYGTDVLEDAGLEVMEIGFESGDDHVSKTMGHGKSLSDCEKLAENQHTYPFRIFWLVLTFFPGETIHSLNETGRFMLKYGFEQEEVMGRLRTNGTKLGLGQFMQPYHGTAMYKTLEKKGMFLTERTVRLIPSYIPNSFLESVITEINVEAIEKTIPYLKLYNVQLPVKPLEIGTEIGEFIYGLPVYEKTKNIICLAILARMGVIR